MPLLNDHLSVWEIGFRWAGYDPQKFWLRIPLVVRDQFRTLIQEIYESRLECLTLRVEKYHGHAPEVDKHYLQHWLPAIEACIAGQGIDRKLLKWASIDRHALFVWCERHKIPLPEFWFPPGWGAEYEWGGAATLGEETPPAETAEQRRTRIGKDHRAKMACQQIALWFWSKKPDMGVKDIILSTEIQEMCDGQHYEFVTVRRWIAEVAPHKPA